METRGDGGGRKGGGTEGGEREEGRREGGKEGRREGWMPVAQFNLVMDTMDLVHPGILPAMSMRV